MFKTIEWTEEGVRMIDQTRLPGEEIYRTYTDYRGVAEAIRSMVIRGAPAIGVAAAMGIAVGIKNSRAKNPSELRAEFEVIAETLAKTRPTAVNLFWAINRMRAVFNNSLSCHHTNAQVLDMVRVGLEEEAKRILAEDIAINEAMGRHGADLMPDAGTVLTHCNAGALATGGYGTALGVIRAAIGAGNDLATMGRRRANATYLASHGVDESTSLIFGIDLTPLLEDERLDVGEYVDGFIHRFAKEDLEQDRKTVLSCCRG